MPAEPGVDWFGRVRAELRPEFAGDVILAADGGPALSGRRCAVETCGRLVYNGALCGAHHKTWIVAGRPEVGAWADSAPPRSKGVRPLRPCDAPGCRRGRYGKGLCQTHLSRWRHAGEPDLPAWLAAGSGPALVSLPRCPVPDCVLEGEGGSGMCISHRVRWTNHGHPPLDEFIVECVTFGHDRFDLRHLPPLMCAEFAYGLQRRADEARTPVTVRGTTGYLDNSATDGRNPFLVWQEADGLIVKIQNNGGDVDSILAFAESLVPLDMDHQHAFLEAAQPRPRHDSPATGMASTTSTTPSTT